MGFFTRLVVGNELNKISREYKARARKLKSKGVTKITPLPSRGEAYAKNCFVCHKEYEMSHKLVITPQGEAVVCNLCCDVYIKTDIGFKPPPRL